MWEASDLEKQSFWIFSLQQSLEKVNVFKETTELQWEAGEAGTHPPFFFMKKEQSQCPKQLWEKKGVTHV